MLHVARKIAILCVLLTVIVAAIAIYHEAEHPAPEAESPFLVPKGFMTLGGTPVSSPSEAEAIVRYDIAVPERIPSGYSLVETRVDSASGVVVMIYSSKKGMSELPPIIDELEYLEQGYWFFYQRPADRGIDPSVLVDAHVKDGFSQRITINGAPGYITCAANASSLEGYLEDGTYYRYLASSVDWWSGGIRYTLVAPTSTTYFQLVDFARSVSI